MTIVLRCSGREIYAHRGILGLNGKDGTLYDGYDGIVDTPDGGPLTKEERQEIAEIMITRWKIWGGVT